MPEPASVALRRLVQEAVAVCLCGLPTCDSCRREGEANTTLRNALPALADLVEAAEKVVAPDYPAQYGDTCHLPLNDALAALRERLGAKP